MPQIHPLPVPAQVVSLKARPHQVSNLCFEVGGILGDLTAQIGMSVLACDFTSVYGKLSSNYYVGDPSLLYYGPDEIHTLVALCQMASLRAEGAKIALNKAIKARQNAFFSKYGSIGEIVTHTKDAYGPTTTDSKTYRLGQLKQLAESQVGALKTAYDNDPVRKLSSPSKGVVTTTQSQLKSTAVGQSAEVDDDVIGVASGDFPQDPRPSGAQFGEGAIQTTDSSVNYDFVEGSSRVKTQQTITNTDYSFRIPYYECEAQYQRAQISLIDQQFTQFMSTLNINNLKTVLENELGNIDSDVYRLQVAYLNTLLVTPLTGIVTAIYKYPGDAVRAGEPVVRIEDNSTVLIEGTIIFAAQIWPNVSTVSLSTTLYGSLALTLQGTILAARGHGQENKWAVIIQCDNPSGLVPPGYAFDYDDTSMTITG